MHLAGTCNTAYSGMFVIRMLLGLAPLLLIAWSGYSTEALPLQNKLPNSTEVLIKTSSEYAEYNVTVQDLGDPEQLLTDKLSNKTTLQEKPPCKDFFWKSLSC